MRPTLFFLALIAITQPAFAQVSEIKSASSSRSSSSGSGREGGSGSGVAADIFFNILFGEVIRAQQQMLQKKDEVPGMVSAELMMQLAAQPSGYYIILPRARVNWGLFSSDFRFNYLVEEKIGEVIHLRTNDWQILQLNLVATKDAVFRLGGGVMHEAFGNGNIYPEWSAALQVHPYLSRVGGAMEYRNAEARREVNAFAQLRIFDQGAAHGFVTAGVVYQRYYQTIPVWGMQGGVIVKFY